MSSEIKFQFRSKPIIESKIYTNAGIPAALSDGKSGFKSSPNLLTEDELIRFLRIPEISKAQNYHNVITHLKRYRNLPCIHICRQPLRSLSLFWQKSIQMTIATVLLIGLTLPLVAAHVVFVAGRAF